MEALVLSAAEAAKVLRIDNNSLLRKLAQGEIPAYREGKSWKVPVSTLKATVENRAITEAKERRAIYESKMESSKI